MGKLFPKKQLSDSKLKTYYLKKAVIDDYSFFYKLYLNERIKLRPGAAIPEE